VFVNPIVCDSAGDVFGTSQQGGGDGYGSVFEVPAGSSTVMPLVAFNPATNGAYPEGALTLNNGNLYGTTSSGTAANDTEGTVFELSTSSTTAGVSATLTFTQQPVSAAVGAIIAPAVTVAIDDASGNLVTADNSDVTLAVASGPAGATLGGTVTVAAQNGVAVFSDLSLSLPGIYTLEATDGTLTAVTSMTFAVSSTSTSGSPAQLAFAQQPSDAIAGATLSPPVVVDVEDSTGALVATDASNVTVAIAGGPAGAMLGGTTTVAAQNGAATFNNLTLSEAGAYTLVATDGALSSATSISFNVAATVSSSPPSQLAPALGKVILPPAIVSGSKLKARISVGITNTGSAFKGGFSVNIYADARTTLDGSQVLVASAAKKVSLKTGKGTTVNFSVNSLPATLADGTYHLLAEVIDPFSQTNVTATTQTVQIAAAFVQPAVTVGAVIPATIALRKSGSVVVTIANAGNVAASGIEIALSPSSDGVTPLAGVILDAVRSGAKIDPGKKKTFRLHFRVPSGAASGSYSPYVSVTLGGVTTSMVGRTQFTVG
jgi:hypothetical protein